MIDPCKDVTCAIAGEVCDGGVCKCGESSSCTGDEKVQYCDSENSKCKCAENVDACSEGQQCIDEECRGIQIWDKSRTKYYVRYKSA